MEKLTEIILFAEKAMDMKLDRSVLLMIAFNKIQLERKKAVKDRVDREIETHNALVGVVLRKRPQFFAKEFTYKVNLSFLSPSSDEN